METQLAVFARRSREACPSCGGRKEPSRLDQLGLEPSSLERETPHHPDCEKLQLKKPLRALVPALSLALFPLAGAGGCQDSDQELGIGPDPMRGLDGGTIGLVDGLVPRDETAG